MSIRACVDKLSFKINKVCRLRPSEEENKMTKIEKHAVIVLISLENHRDEF